MDAAVEDLPRREVTQQQSQQQQPSSEHRNGDGSNIQHGNLSRQMSPGHHHRRVLRFAAPPQGRAENMRDNLFSLTPLGASSRRLLSSPQRTQRYVPKAPFKVLDAPYLPDDFYLNLVDWSSTNTVAVGLVTSVYLWSALTSQVTQLCEMDDSTVASVSWSKSGSRIAVGTSNGAVKIWDTQRSVLVNEWQDHTARVGAMAWTDAVLATGSRDKSIYLYDVRERHRRISQLQHHRQEVCGIQWSQDGIHLASGGNDNQLVTWDIRTEKTDHVFTDHRAAVKAIAWSPHQHGLLVSGGGTADQTIRFWNTLTGQPLQVIQTNSQVRFPFFFFIGCSVWYILIVKPKPKSRKTNPRLKTILDCSLANLSKKA